MRLLFISHLFPDGSDPWRGLENVAMLQTLANRWEIRAVALRPVRLWSGQTKWHPRAADVTFRPEFIATPTLPLVGTRWNLRRAAGALRKRLDRIRRDWHFDAVLAASLLPDACVVSRLADEFQFRFVVLALQDESEKRLGEAGTQSIIASHLARAAGVVTDSSALGTLLTQTRFRKDRLTLVSTQESATEACHRLLLPVRG
jgi:hypothetical protein